MSSAVVKARIAGANAAYCEVSTSPTFSGVVSFPGVEGADSVWTFDLDGLDPATQHYWRLRGSSVEGRFRTPPEPGTPYSFEIALASCAGRNGDHEVVDDTSDAPTFDRIRDRDPLFFWHLGDMHYRDIDTNDVGRYRTAFRDVLSNARQHDLYRHVAVAYEWDDHDYGPNNSDGTHVGKPAAQQAFREYVPHFPLAADERSAGDGEIYQTFVVGRVRFVLLDVRSGRSPNSATDDENKTMLGDDQKQWLQDLLLAADEPVIVVGTSMTWVDNTDHMDSWSGFRTEREELSQFFHDNDLTGRIVLVGGDTHWLCADDGTNTQYADGVTDPGPPYFGFAPLDAMFTSTNGTYSEGTHQDSRQQYGTIEFDDQGSQVVVTGKGWAVDGGTETEVFSLQHTIAVPS